MVKKVVTTGTEAMATVELLKPTNTLDGFLKKGDTKEITLRIARRWEKYKIAKILEVHEAQPVGAEADEEPPFVTGDGAGTETDDVPPLVTGDGAEVKADTGVKEVTEGDDVTATADAKEDAKAEPAPEAEATAATDAKAADAKGANKADAKKSTKNK